jgi:hypothetical protein
MERIEKAGEKRVIRSFASAHDGYNDDGHMKMVSI